MCGPLTVELWGIVIGLQYCCDNGWNKVVVQVDAKVACFVIRDLDSGRTSRWSIVREICKLLHLTWEVNIVNIFREANQCVDGFANLGCS